MWLAKDKFQMKITNGQEAYAIKHKSELCTVITWLSSARNKNRQMPWVDQVMGVSDLSDTFDLRLAQ